MPSSTAPRTQRAGSSEGCSTISWRGSSEVPPGRSFSLSCAIASSRRRTSKRSLASWTRRNTDDSAPRAAKATSGDTSYKVGGSVSEPVELSRVRPVYPPEARAKGLTGVVKLNAVIDESGTVTSVESIQSPDSTLTAAAVGAVGHWTYKPAMKDGKPVRVRLSVTVSFMLDTTPSK